MPSIIVTCTMVYQMRCGLLVEALVSLLCPSQYCLSGGHALAHPSAPLPGQRAMHGDMLCHPECPRLVHFWAGNIALPSEVHCEVVS